VSGASSVFTTLDPLASRARHLDPNVTHLPRVYLGAQFRPMQGDLKRADAAYRAKSGTKFLLE
jgi:hypothetical protein